MATVENGEQLVAERDVTIRDRQTMSVRISQHEAEDWWRVQVANPAGSRGAMSTTVAGGDSFLMKLIEEAVDGTPAAWNHLAQWGHANLTRPATGFRAALV